MFVAPSSAVGFAMKIGIAVSAPPMPMPGLATPVGCTVLTRMRCGASSFAKAFISPTTPCLLAT